MGTCIVIGAGLAGLSAARTLEENGVDAVVCEQAAEIGGRMSTTVFRGGVFDDGAQFFTVKDPRFEPLVREWLEAGVLTDWFHSQLIRGGAANPDGYPRYCGVEGMRSVIQHQAEGIEVRTKARAVAFSSVEGGYEVALAGGDTLSGDALVITAPVTSALELVQKSGFELRKQDGQILDRLHYTPSITVLATLEEPSALTEWGGLRIEGEYIDWIADNYRKGISPEPAVTIQAMPEFSRERWDLPEKELSEILLENAAAVLRARPVDAKVRRWLLGKPWNVHPEPYVSLSRHPRVLLAGDGFQGYRVEGAAISGIEAARGVINALK